VSTAKHVSYTKRRLAAFASISLIAGGIVGVGLAIGSPASAAAPSPHGYANVNGTTTGGGSGPTVTVTTLAAFKTAAASSTAETILVNGHFTSSGAEVTVASNKTIRGVGSSSGLTGIGLKLKSVNNVIIQNLVINKVLASSGNGDSIHIEKSTHLFIDHNDLSSDTSHGTDYYDGQLDITHAADYITVSYNYIHDHIKCSLVGHSDSNSSEDTGKLHVTYDHNYFKNCDQRTPSIRFGTLHAYNNYFVNGSTGIHTRMGAQALVQNNVWSGVTTPIETTEDSSVDGYVNQSGNIFGSGTNKITRTGSLTSVPYSYSLGSASSVAAYVTANAGTGKI
jgi:pectate lyase